MLKRLRQAIVVLSALSMLGIPIPGTADAAVTYGYDPLGRVTTALYDDGLCVVYGYDANGNRISQANTISSPPESAVWGTGTWGCFHWTPQ
jgi:YD repeat-containing protein